ncbi:MAG: DegT/DnrJ/EryC1/StrS family aminotransferase, partial [Proteobacteria bacterium]|nr:DegT/DnrJ/EryC1/StrS family aminotransferase [Pseudomonadota bacterium]
MWPRIRFDIGWWDLAYGLWACAAARDRDHWQRAVESLWSADGGALACHSVRGGFDLLLSSLALPRGSEVLFSALNVKGMIKIARRHGLVPVPVDLDPDTMGPRPDALRRAIGPRSRVLVVAHLFGCRLDLEVVLSLAEEHELFVVEDCAQAFAGLGYRGHPRANVSAFSFGPLKTASALGGALLQVRDPHVLDAMRELQA